MAYLGFYFGGGGGGGVQNILENWGYLHGYVLYSRGVRGYAPPRNLKNGAIWCVLENILLKFCKNKIVKMFYFI